MKIATVVGARPQFIKAATVSRCIERTPGVSEVLVHTGQHYNATMSDVFFAELEIRQPDYNLGIGGGTHGENTGRMLEAIERVLVQERPDWVLVYGDTDSTLAGALATVKLNIPLAHVEAGLRSFNRTMPEEINRVLTDHAADMLFAPTATSVANLAAEGIKGDKVKMTGDVMYDASLYYRSKARKPTTALLDGSEPFVLCTIHRAENTNAADRLAAIVSNLNRVAEQQQVFLPLHPRTVAALERLQEPKLSASVQVVEPVSFLEMTWLLYNCSIVVTDSGGMQKEAYFYQKPCITLRDETEWVELVSAGVNRLLCPVKDDVLANVQQMQSMIVTTADGLYGYGDAADNIVRCLLE